MNSFFHIKTITCFQNTTPVLPFFKFYFINQNLIVFLFLFKKNFKVKTAINSCLFVKNTWKKKNIINIFLKNFYFFSNIKCCFNFFDYETKNINLFFKNFKIFFKSNNLQKKGSVFLVKDLISEKEYLPRNRLTKAFNRFIYFYLITSFSMFKSLASFGFLFNFNFFFTYHLFYSFNFQNQFKFLIDPTFFVNKKIWHTEKWINLRFIKNNLLKKNILNLNSFLI